MITGEIGAGKTTLLQSLLRRLDERIVVARLVNTTLDPRELLEAILLDFGLETAGKTKPQLLHDLGQFLVEQRQQGNRALLVVDEAQNLSLAALEEIRLLSNLETEKSKLLQIVLAGQPNLRQTLALPGLEQLRQRIAVSYHLRPLDAHDTATYINARLAHAALSEPLTFPRDAAEEVYRRSGGLPRLINVICEAALVFGYAEERRTIDAVLIGEVIAELELTGVMLWRAPRHRCPPQFGRPRCRRRLRRRRVRWRRTAPPARRRTVPMVRRRSPSVNARSPSASDSWSSSGGCSKSSCGCAAHSSAPQRRVRPSHEYRHCPLHRRRSGLRPHLSPRHADGCDEYLA